jgi:hypothetical protein
MDAAREAKGGNAPAASPQAEAGKTRERAMALLPLAAVAVGAAILLWLAGIVLFGGTPESRCASALLPEWRDSCFNSLAVSSGDYSYCERIARGSLRDTCLSSVGSASPQDREFCMRLPEGAARDRCLLALARQTGLAGDCNGISSQLGLEQCYLEAASASLNPSLCSLLDNNVSRMECQNRIYSELAVKQSNPLLCRQIEYLSVDSRQALQDACFAEAAAALNDTSACQYILNETVRANCQAPSANADCSTYTDSNSKGVCYYARAVNGLNASECALVPGASLRDNCYYQIAISTFNYSACEGIASQGLRQACLQSSGRP